MRIMRKTLPIALLLAITSCGGQKQEPVLVETDSVETIVLPKYNLPTSADPTLQAVSRYITDSLSANYDSADVSIPLIQVVAQKTTKEGSVEVYGNFHLWNYTLDADTLFCASGGSYPGKMTVKEGRVVRFECVEDGSRFKSSARRIFGRFFKPFQIVYSDDKAREQERLTTIKEYVSRHYLRITHVRDYGWPAVALPESPFKTNSETTNAAPVSSSKSTSSRTYSSRGHREPDNMRGFDPASEDDMDDNGMSRYFDNNDDEGWD